MLKKLAPLVWLLIIGTLFRLAISRSIYSGDLNNHVGWGASIIRSGFGGAYDREYTGIMQPTYPPVALYAFSTSVGFYDWLNDAIHQLNKQFSVFPSGLVWWFEDQNTAPAFTKVIAIVSDVGVATLLYIFARRFKASATIAWWVAALYFLNPAVWYVSALWGQIESLPLFFLLLTIYYIARSMPLAAGITLAAMVLSKQTSIIFLPFIGLIAWKKFRPSVLIASAFMAIAVFIASYLPFSTSSSPLWPIQVYVNRIQTGSGSVWISDHAFNPWALLTHLQKIPDSTTVVGPVSAQIIGYLVFGSVFLISFLTFSKRRIQLPVALAITAFAAFLFLTKMHERYLAPVIPLLLLVAVRYKRVWPLVFTVSVVHLVNLYHEWYFPRFTPLDLWVANWNTITTCIIVLLVSFIVLFSLAFRRRP